METLQITINEMLKFVPKTVFVMFCSLTVTYLIIKNGFLSYLGKISRPVTYFLKLPEQAAAASVLAFGSALSANVMLSEFHQKKIISEEEAYLGALLNGASVTVKEIFTYQFPVIMPILGLKAGLIYFLCFTSAAVIKYFYIYLYLRFSKSNDRIKNDFIQLNDPKPEIELSCQKQLKTFLKLSAVYISVTFMILFALNAGLTVYFEKAVKPINEFLRLPSVLALPVSTFIFSPVAGASAIGSLLTKNTISAIDAALAVILGSLLLIPLYTLRGSMSRSISIFGTKLGVKIATTSTALTMLSRLIFIVLILIYKGVIKL
ncbi:MAG: hypothetical protein ABII74_10555 [Elusimicrobiota bacterium]